MEERERERKRVLSARKGYLIFKLHVAERKRPPFEKIGKVGQPPSQPKLSGNPLLHGSTFAWDFISQDNEQFYKYTVPARPGTRCRLENRKRTTPPRRRRRRVSSSRALTIRACAPKYIYIYIQVDNIKTNNRQLFWFRQYSTHVRRIAVRHFYVNAPLYFTEFHRARWRGCETFTATRELTLIRGHDNLCDRFATALFEYRWPGRKRVYHKVDFH